MDKQQRERLRDWVLGQPGMGSVRINSHDLIELLDYCDTLEARSLEHVVAFGPTEYTLSGDSND